MSKLIIRKINESDLSNGFLDSLESLRSVGKLDKAKAIQILRDITKNPNHVIFVVEYDGKIVGSTTLLIEQKFIHEGGKVGHIEDVVISKQFHSKGIGVKIIQEVLEYAKTQGCYKTILDCADNLKPFYEKIGFVLHSNGMRFNH